MARPVRGSVSVGASTLRRRMLTRARAWPRPFVQFPRAGDFRVGRSSTKAHDRVRRETAIALIQASIEKDREGGGEAPAGKRRAQSALARFGPIVRLQPKTLDACLSGTGALLAPRVRVFGRVAR